MEIIYSVYLAIILYYLILSIKNHYKGKYTKVEKNFCGMFIVIVITMLTFFGHSIYMINYEK